MQSKGLRNALLASVTIVLAVGCGNQSDLLPAASELKSVEPMTSSEVIIATQLKAKLEQLLPNLPAEHRANIAFVDLKAGYQYDKERGLEKIETGRFDPAAGVYRYKNGAVVAASPDTRKASISSQNLNALAVYQPYRQVRAVDGFKGVTGNVIVPLAANVGGVDNAQAGGNEAAYNYLALYTANANLEGGVFVSGDTRYYTPNVWYGYYSFGGTQTALRDWPQANGGFPANSQVQMTLDIPSPGTVTLTMTLVDTGQSKTYALGFSPARTDGVGMVWGRTTSLLVNTNGYTRGNAWYNLQLIQPPNYNKVTWTSNYTRTGFPTNVTTGGTSITLSGTVYRDYQETVNINQP